jgi:hypothetical protein
MPETKIFLQLQSVSGEELPPSLRFGDGAQSALTSSPSVASGMPSIPQRTAGAPGGDVAGDTKVSHTFSVDASSGYRDCTWRDELEAQAMESRVGNLCHSAEYFSGIH